MVESYDLSLIMSRLQLGAALGGPQVNKYYLNHINKYLSKYFYCCFPVPHVPRRVPLGLDAGHGHGEEARAHHDQDTELALRRAGPYSTLIVIRSLIIRAREVSQCTEKTLTRALSLLSS